MEETYSTLKTMLQSADKSPKNKHKPKEMLKNTKTSKSNDKRNTSLIKVEKQPKSPVEVRVSSKSTTVVKQ